jgi:hypothetical protein
MKPAVARVARVGVLIGSVWSAAVARASGSPERIAEILTHPTDPDVIVARYGKPGSNKGAGLLFSSDGGKTFQASCADFITVGMTLSSSDSLYKSNVHIDGTGQLFTSGSTDELFVGDATGCTFEHEPGFQDTRAVSFAADPADPGALYAFVSRRKDPEKARSYVVRRDAAGRWSEIAEVHDGRGTNDDVNGADLIVAKSPSGSLRVAVLYNVYSYDTNANRFFVASSDDGAKTFTSHPLVRSDDDAPFRLLGFDPADPSRIIALDFRTGRTDKLLLSSDGGGTFSSWAEVDTFTGMTFGEGGRVYVASTTDSLPDSAGGLFVAERVGAPLTRLRDSLDLDCVHYRASDKQLFGCHLDKLGSVDAKTGAFTTLSRMLAVETLISCGARDAARICEEQLTAKAAWCCVGHYPWTPFCGQYDKSMPICGRSAQEYECEQIGDCGPGATPDAGMPMQRDAASAPAMPEAGTRRDADVRTPGSDRGAVDADEGREEESARKQAASGCTLATPQSAPDWLAAFALFAGALRRRPRCAPT